MVTSFAEFERAVGSAAPGFLPLAVRGFFENGGDRCYVAPIGPGDAIEAGLNALAAETVILCCPDEHHFPGAAAKLAAHCEERKDRLCILQSPRPQLSDASHRPPVSSSYAAYYYPRLVVADVTGQSTVTVPPGGHVAGAYARMEQEHGVHSAPTNVRLLAVHGLSEQISSARSELLAARGINTLRSLPGRGILFGNALTSSADSEWKYVSVPLCANMTESAP